MVPQAFVTLTALPLMPNGKLDRKALPAPDRQGASADYLAPRNEIETTLANLFAEVLGHERVGINDNFFELGGDSIRAVGLCSRISAASGNKLPVAVLFAKPSVAEIADYYAGTGVTATRRITLRRSHGTRHAICFLPTALGLGLAYRGLAQQLATAADTFTCALPGCAPGELPLTSVEDIAAHCMRALVVPDTHDEWSLVGWSFGGVVAYEMARQMQANGLAVRRLVLIDAYLPSDTGNRGPSNEANESAQENGALISGEASSPPGPSSTIGELRHLPDGLQFEAVADLGDLAAVSRLYHANVSALRHYRPARCQLSSVEIRAAQTVSRLSGDVAAPHSLPGTLRRVIVLPGDHYSIMGGESVRSLAAAIDEGIR
jgi:thioesterase domain-containing protein/acyl carrier protein